MLRQAIIRIFAIKMLNLAFTAVQLENPNDLLGGDSDPDDARRAAKSTRWRSWTRSRRASCRCATSR